MQVTRLCAFLALFPAFWTGIAGGQSPSATLGFKIEATNVTMPPSGNGSTQYTVTGIPITGNLIVNCTYAGDPTGLKIPYCGGGPVNRTSVKAGQTVTGTINFSPFAEPVPVKLDRTGHTPGAGLALAGALLLGLGFRCKARRWLALTVMAVGTLAGLAGLSGCTGSFNGMTPGTYQYTVTAANGEPNNNVLASATTSINVTVP